MNTSTIRNGSPITFFILVFALSVPFSLAGTMTGLELLPGLPISSLVVNFCPLAAALILVYRENRTAGITGLLQRSFDFKRIKVKTWYVPIFLLMPAVMILSYGVARSMGIPVPAPQFPILAPLVMFPVFYIAALGEELGWMGYSIDLLQNRFNALQAGILLGLPWAAWHIIPVVQVGRSPVWIAGQILVWLSSRVIIVWLYNNTGKSVFAAATFHAMMNVTWQLFPVNGSFYDPRILGPIVALAAVIVTFLWGSKTLAQYRYARPNADVHLNPTN